MSADHYVVFGNGFRNPLLDPKTIAWFAMRLRWPGLKSWRTLSVLDDTIGDRSAVRLTIALSTDRPDQPFMAHLVFLGCATPHLVPESHNLWPFS